MKVKFNETRLGKRPPLATPRMGFSPDGKRVAWAARDGAKARIEINGVAAFTAERVDRMFFTPDSSRWIGLERRGAKWHVVVDGTAGPAFDRVENFVFSPAGDRVGYVGTRGTRQVAVIDGTESPEQDFVFGLTWAGDGRVLFAGYDGGSAQLIVDGAAVGSSYKTMSIPAVSADGKSIAVAVQRADGKELAVVNGTEGPAHVKALEVTMSRDGKHTAYVGLDDLARVFVDGVPGAAHPSAFLVVFSPDGNRLAYVATTADDKMLVVVEGAAEPQHVRVDGLRFSEDSKRLLYLAADPPDRTFIVVDSVEFGPFNELSRSTSLFGAGGKRWSTVATVKGKQIVVVDGVSGKPYDSVREPSFSDDGQIVAFGATKAGRTLVVINGTEFDKYKRAMLTGPLLHFVTNRVLAFHVIRGDEVLLVEAEITP